MKLASKSKKSVKAPPVVEIEDQTDEHPLETVEAESAETETPEVSEETETKLQTLEERVSSAETAIANVIDRAEEALQDIDSKLSAVINKAAPRMLELINVRLDQQETRLFYRIIDFFGQCPFWEMKKIMDGEKSTTNGEDLFAAAFKDGWRYIGNFTHPSKATERYSLFCRPKNGPISDGEYLKMYEEFQERANKRVEEKHPTPAPEPKAEKKKLLLKPKKKSASK